MTTTPLNIYEGSITFKDFAHLRLPEAMALNALLDWRLHLMDWRDKELDPSQKIYVEYEIEATDQLLQKI